MTKHEDKTCAKCGDTFECKVGDIAHCQCTGVQFTPAEYAFVAEQYSDCLCIQCLIALKQLYHQQNFASKIKDQFGQR